MSAARAGGPAVSARVVRVESVLDAPVPVVWDLMCRLDTFLYVCRGVLGVPAVRGWPETAEVGRSGEAWILLFHLIPLHRHHIEIVEVDPAWTARRPDASRAPEWRWRKRCRTCPTWSPWSRPRSG